MDGHLPLREGALLLLSSLPSLPNLPTLPARLLACPAISRLSLELRLASEALLVEVRLV